jgi:Zn-finger nucleic acid-binding protein
VSAGPYREAPKFLPCPRCGELLERAFEEILACLRCEGIWITPPMAGIAFQDPGWPSDATSMWWKSALACPECALAGRPSTMTAWQAEGVVIDRCATHGLWLDRGELGRILRSKGHELDELRIKILGGGDSESLIAKRDEWRKEAERKRREAEEYRVWLEWEQKRRIAEADARRRAEEEAIERSQAPVVELPPDRPLDPSPAERRAEQARLDAERVERERVAREAREQAAVRTGLVEARMEVAKVVADLEREIRTLRTQLHAAEGRLESERIRLRMIGEQIAKLVDEPKLLG